MTDQDNYREIIYLKGVSPENLQGTKVVLTARSPFKDVSDRPFLTFQSAAALVIDIKLFL
jgi:hypothetical protein